MWIITFSDNSVGETIEVVAYSMEEVRAIIGHAEESDGILELEHLEQRWMVFGLQGLKDITDNGIPGNG